MLKKFLKALKGKTEELSSTMEEVLADYTAGNEAASEAFTAIQHDYQPTLSHMVLLLAAPLRSTVLNRKNGAFLYDFHQVNERDLKQIRTTLEKDYEIYDRDGVYHQTQMIWKTGSGLFSILIILHIVCLAVDAGYIQEGEVEGLCVPVMDPLFFQDGLSGWDTYVSEIMKSEEDVPAFTRWSFKQVMKGLLTDPNSPWRLLSFETIRQTYLDHYCDLEARERVTTFMEGLTVPEVHDLPLILSAPLRLSSTYGFITRLVTYGQLDEEQQDYFRSVLARTFNITDRHSLEEALDRLHEQVHIPYFAITALFYISSAIELNLVEPSEVQDRIDTHLRTVLVDAGLTSWPELAESYVQTNDEYLIQDPDLVQANLVELFTTGYSPWRVYDFETLKRVFLDHI